MARRVQPSAILRRSRPWKRLAIALGAALVGLLLAEGGLRAVQALRGRPYSADAARGEVRGLVSLMTQALPDRAADLNATTSEQHLLQPFIGVDQALSLAEMESQQWAFRTPREPRPFVVLILGGSVAAQTAGHSQVAIADRLRADPRLAGREPVLLCQARGALKQPQQATQLAALYALGWRPDVVVNIDGFNELALARDNAARDVHPAWPSYWAWALLAKPRADMSDEWRLAGRVVALADEGAALGRELVDSACLSSALYGELALRRLRSIQHRWAAAQHDYQRFLTRDRAHDSSMGPPVHARAPAAAERAVEIWRESSVTLHGMAAAHGALYVHILQPTLHDRGSKPLTEEELASSAGPPGWDAWVEEGYPRLRAAGAELVARGVRFVDLSQVFRDFAPTTYFDGCHFAGAGMQLFGRHVAQAILDALPPG